MILPRRHPYASTSTKAAKMTKVGPRGTSMEGQRLEVIATITRRSKVGAQRLLSPLQEISDDYNKKLVMTITRESQTHIFL